MVRQVLGTRVSHRTPAFTRAAELLPFLEDGDFGLLHLACHSNNPPNRWQVVPMADGGFRTYHLKPATKHEPPALARRRPLIFFNACCTADRVAETATPAWAESFLKAGAGAFVGSAWDVRSPLARKFARHFYSALVEREAPTIGEAVLRARRRMAGAADPTWLAYAVYADANAVLRWS